MKEEKDKTIHRANLLYGLRHRPGVEVDTERRLIFLPMGGDPGLYPEIGELCREYGYGVQYVLPT